MGSREWLRRGRRWLVVLAWLLTLCAVAPFDRAFAQVAGESAPDHSPFPIPDSRLSISLLTIGPGELFFERFGHNAIVVREAGRPAVVYNYGIFDFAQGDRIDLAALAADGGDFAFIGGSAQTGARQLQVIQSSAAATVNLFLDEDAVADLVIELTVADGHALTHANFIGVAGPGGQAAFDQPEVVTGPEAFAVGPDADDAISGCGLVWSELHDRALIDRVTLPRMVSPPLDDWAVTVATHDLLV